GRYGSTRGASFMPGARTGRAETGQRGFQRMTPVRKALGPAILVVAAASLLAALLFLANAPGPDPARPPEHAKMSSLLRFSGMVQKGQSLHEIFKRHDLDPRQLFPVKEALAGVHSPREFRPGRPYEIQVDPEKGLHAFLYWASDEALVRVTRAGEGYRAERLSLEYEKRILCLEGSIEDNLIASMGGGPQNLLLALGLSDIFAWDIDFTTALRRGDTFRVLVEGLYRDGEFRKYGGILAAEFVNDGVAYRAYRFEIDGKADYYDAEGRSLRKAFLKAPLSFRRISSGFSKSRLHPVLKIRRAHNGTDYVAPKGTPVSAMAAGQVVAAGWQGGYGRLVVLRHPNGYKTYYGHLSGFAKGIRKGATVAQGQLVGYVGATGLATGPHLHFEMRLNDRPVNPRKVAIPPGEPVPEALLAAYKTSRDELAGRLASVPPLRFAAASR
ncbi:MAG TPA: peptidoglycan DD-metalloendopeptidase family protein, partial [Syntrophales bacterium]|nr:peptidoglycan DD-metalloendopeptidase family protein [Syntrophales bacterium]